MNPMGLGPLDNPAQPPRRANVPVIKIFRHGDEDGVDAGGFQTAAEQQKDQGTAHDRVDDDFNGMFVKTGDQFDPAW